MIASSSVWSFLRSKSPFAFGALLLAATPARADVKAIILPDLGGSSIATGASGHHVIGNSQTGDGLSSFALLWDLRHPAAAPTVLATHPGAEAGFATLRSIDGHIAVGSEVTRDQDGNIINRAAVWDSDWPHDLPSLLPLGPYANTAGLVLDGTIIAGGGFDGNGQEVGLVWDLKHPHAAPTVLGANFTPTGIGGSDLVGTETVQNQDGSTSIVLDVWDLRHLDRAPRHLATTGTADAIYGASGRWVVGADQATNTPLVWDLDHLNAAPRALAKPATGLLLGVNEEWEVGLGSDTNSGFAIRIHEHKATPILLTGGANQFSVALGVDGDHATGLAQDANGVFRAAVWTLPSEGCDH